MGMKGVNMSLLEKLKAGKNNVKVITWPGTDEKVGLIVLTEAEKQRAAFETEKKFKSSGVEYNYGTAETYQSEQNTQMLVLSLVDPDKRTPLFKSADDLRPLLVTGVKSILIEQVNDWQQECSPSIEEMTEQKYQELFETVKKNPSILNGTNLNTLRQLITFLASQPASSPMDSGSTPS